MLTELLAFLDELLSYLESVRDVEQSSEFFPAYATRAQQGRKSMATRSSVGRKAVLREDRRRSSG
jgi:hypothetical protein